MRRIIVLERLMISAAALALASTTNAAGCAADLDGDAVVNGLDLAILLGAWGPATPCPPPPPADLDGNCIVNGLDLAMLLAAWGDSCQPLTTQLAGHSLAAYPHFEHVRAFNQGSTLQVAIDPTRFPELVGSTCAVHVVAHRTIAQWAADRSLLDLTGGPQVQVIVAGTVQANTFTISGSDTLSAAAGANLGVGYDVVLDCNSNGILDGADVIDGYGDEAGLYVVHDTTLPGPYSVTEITYQVPAWTGPAGFAGENTFYPSNIAALGELPLVVVSHGNGHNYLWYDHIGNHLASYGYLVMSHQNNTVPGVASAATTTFEHTNAIIAQQAAIAGGVLNGHIDADNIMWIGHSRGGEGIVIAFDRVFDRDTVPVGWSLDGIRLLSSMAPVSYLGPVSSDPHDVNYHLWVGTADNDVSSCPINDSRQSYQLHDRATGFRQSTSIYGAGHGDFHNGPTGSVAAGPCLIGRATTHAIMRGYFLPLVERYFHGNVPAKDFLWRQWKSFHPIGAPADNPCVVVNFMYRDGSATGNFKIDDFQTNPSTTVSSAGAAVSYNVTNVVEDRLDDTNTDLTWMASDPMNGMTFASATDTSRGIVFDWDVPRFMEFAVPPAAQDFTSKAYLSFRACQGTRHPLTIAELDDLTFTITLRDDRGVTSTINIGAYGGGIEEPYQRSGCGVGAGWANEMETIRIRLSDFLTNGSALDLASIIAVRIDFATPGASAVGRMGFDELELTTD